jgi:hypothetical protein
MKDMEVFVCSTVWIGRISFMVNQHFDVRLAAAHVAINHENPANRIGFALGLSAGWLSTLQGFVILHDVRTDRTMVRAPGRGLTEG